MEADKQVNQKIAPILPRMGKLDSGSLTACARMIREFSVSGRRFSRGQGRTGFLVLLRRVLYRLKHRGALFRSSNVTKGARAKILEKNSSQGSSSSN